MQQPSRRGRDIPRSYVLTLDDATSDEARYAVVVNGRVVAEGAELRAAAFVGDVAPDPEYGGYLADLDPAVVTGGNKVELVLEPRVDFAPDGVTTKRLYGGGVGPRGPRRRGGDGGGPAGRGLAERRGRVLRLA